MSMLALGSSKYWGQCIADIPLAVGSDCSPLAAPVLALEPSSRADRPSVPAQGRWPDGKLCGISPGFSFVPTVRLRDCIGAIRARKLSRKGCLAGRVSTHGMSAFGVLLRRL